MKMTKSIAELPQITMTFAGNDGFEMTIGGTGFVQINWIGNERCNSTENFRIGYLKKIHFWVTPQQTIVFKGKVTHLEFISKSLAVIDVSKNHLLTTLICEGNNAEKIGWKGN